MRAIDFHKDGDLDLFVSGRVEPGSCPRPVSSFIYINDSKNGIIKFADATKEVAGDSSNVGLVCGAAFIDFNNNGWLNLILAGKWMLLTFLKMKRAYLKIQQLPQVSITRLVGGTPLLPANLIRWRYKF